LADGILQFRPEIWVHHRPSVDAKIESLIAQVAATESLLEEMRRELEINAGEALQYIKEVYFGNDEDEFQKNFFALAVIGSFNAGARSYSSMINDFYKKVLLTGKIETIKQYYLPNMNLAGRDLFQLMILMAKEIGWGVDFGDDGFGYVSKIFAARMVLDNVSPQQRVDILGETA
jgi:hypothetical protein